MDLKEMLKQKQQLQDMKKGKQQPKTPALVQKPVKRNTGRGR